MYATLLIEKNERNEKVFFCSSCNKVTPIVTRPNLVIRSFMCFLPVILILSVPVLLGLYGCFYREEVRNYVIIMEDGYTDQSSLEHQLFEMNKQAVKEGAIYKVINATYGPMVYKATINTKRRIIMEASYKDGKNSFSYRDANDTDNLNL